MSRALKITLGALVALLALSIITLPSLRRAAKRLGGPPRTAEQARREMIPSAISTPTDVKVRAQMYWISATSPTSVEPTQIELPLSADPVERAKQLLNALVADAPSPDRRTLPADTTLLAFYLQRDGTAIADFSDALSGETPSGILSEQLAVESIAWTLGANVDTIQHIKILIRGQESDTLAGHLDLSEAFPVRPAAAAVAPGTSSSVALAVAANAQAGPEAAIPAPSLPTKAPSH